MLGLGMSELVVILVVVVVVFGPSRLPQVGQALGTSIRGFRKASRGEDDPPANAFPGTVEASAAESGAGKGSEPRPVSGCDAGQDPERSPKPQAPDPSQALR